VVNLKDLPDLFSFNLRDLPCFCTNVISFFLLGTNNTFCTPSPSPPYNPSRPKQLLPLAKRQLLSCCCCCYYYICFISAAAPDLYTDRLPLNP